jgi:hypothetical protein
MCFLTTFAHITVVTGDLSLETQIQISHQKLNSTKIPHHSVICLPDSARSFQNFQNHQSEIMQQPWPPRAKNGFGDPFARGKPHKASVLDAESPP